MSSYSFYGVPNELYYRQHDRTDELNQRVQERQFPDSPLAPNFSPRPVLSKYSRFPIFDRHMPNHIPIEEVAMHSVETNFNPATRLGPVSTYMKLVDLETDLRQQNVALQKGAPQGIYVPSSTSDLYQVVVPSRKSENPHPLLQEVEISATSAQAFMENVPIGKDTFHNHTRTQLRSKEK